MAIKEFFNFLKICKSGIEEIKGFTGEAKGSVESTKEVVEEVKNLANKTIESTDETKIIAKHNELQKIYEELLNKPQANFNPKTGYSYLYNPEANGTTSIRVIKGKIDNPFLPSGIRYSGATPISEKVKIKSNPLEDGSIATWGRVRTSEVQALYDPRKPFTSPWLNGYNSRDIHCREMRP